MESKFLYGLESAQISDTLLAKLDTFQLKGFRKILRMDTTYINRTNTNLRVIQEANRKIVAEGEPHR